MTRILRPTVLEGWTIERGHSTKAKSKMDQIEWKTDPRRAKLPILRALTAPSSAQGSPMDHYGAVLR